MTTGKLLPAVLGLLTFCIVAESAQQLSFKAGSARAERARSYVGGIVSQPLIWVGILLWVIESIAWVLVLQRSPLSMAYPVMTLTYATVPLAGVVVLREPMPPRQMLGAALIFAGVIMVGVAGV